MLIVQWLLLIISLAVFIAIVVGLVTYVVRAFRQTKPYKRTTPAKSGGNRLRRKKR